MYIVVSRWEPVAGKEEEFEAKGKTMRNMLRSQPGIKMIEGFRSEDGGAVAIVGYESKDAYERIINDPDGPFATAAEAQKIEETARWVRSERGEAMPD